MLPGALATQTVVVVEPTLVDDRGTLVPDWTQEPASRTQVEGCAVQPLAGSEDVDGRQHTTARWKVWLPPCAPVTAFSALECAGVRYQVDGPPLFWGDPFENLSHVTVEVVVWRG